MNCLVNLNPANPVRGFPLLLVALEWAINGLLPYWRVLETANWGGDYKMLVMHPMSPFFPSFYVLLSFDFHFPLPRSLFSGHLTSCKPPLVSGVKGHSQTSCFRVVDFSLMASEELPRQPGPKQFLSHLDATPAQGVGPDFGCSFGSEFACVERYLD